MPRTALPGSKQHRNYVPVRLNDEEFAKLEVMAKASGATRSDIFRRLLKGHKAIAPAPSRLPLIDAQAIAEIRRIGVNINQIARELNREDRTGVDPKEFQNLDRALLQFISMITAGPDRAKELVNIGLSEMAPFLQIAPNQVRRK